MRNRLSGLALKEEKDAKVALRLNVVRLKCDRCLKLRYRQIRPILVEKLLRFLEMRSDFLALSVRCLSDQEYCAATHEDQNRKGAAELCIHTELSTIN